MSKVDEPRASRKAIPPQDRMLIDADHVARLLSVSRWTVLTWRKNGLLPAPIELGAGTVLWRVKELESWVSAGCPPTSDWTWRATVPAKLDTFIRIQSREIIAMKAALDDALRAKAAGETLVPLSLGPDCSPTQ